MGKKRGARNQPHHSPRHQQQESAEVEAAPAAVEEIKTPVKPEVDTFQAEPHPVEESQEEAAVAVEVELSPGGESPTTKKDRSAEPVEEQEAAAKEEEIVEQPPVEEQKQAEEVRPMTPILQATPQSQALESPASTVDAEPLLPSTNDSDVEHSQGGAASPQPEPMSTSKVVSLAQELMEQPVVQFVLVVAQRLLVAFLVVLIRVYRFTETTELFTKARATVEEKVIEKHFKNVDLKVVAGLGYTYVDTRVLTPLGMWDTATLQGQTLAAVLSAAIEMKDEAVAQSQRKE